MRIIRPSLSKGEFVGIPNATARDHRLSWRARGLLAELLSYADGWETSVDKLVQQARSAGGNAEGRDAMRVAMNELEKFGYVHHVRQPDSRGRWVTLTEVFGVPHQPVTEAGISGVGKPGVGRPVVGEPGVGRSGVTKKTDTKTDTKTDRKDLQGSEQSSTASARYAPSSGGVEDDEQADEFVEITDEPPTSATKNLTEARANDRDIFHQLVGDKIRSDGAKFTEGTFDWGQFYDAFRKWKRKRPITWPGKMLERIAEDSPDGSAGDWLMYLGLEAA